MSLSGSPTPGDGVRVVMSKWGGRPHWEFDCVFLGSDAHGDWCGIPAGTLLSRPGADYVAPVTQVGLAPAGDADAADRWWLATFHDRGAATWRDFGIPVQAYVDMTTPPVWDGTVLRAVDLDLDVVRGTTGRVWVDDEDEFAEHRAAFGYPEDVVTAAVASCEAVQRAMLAAQAPYDGVTHLPWLDLARAL